MPKARWKWFAMVGAAAIFMLGTLQAHALTFTLTSGGWSYTVDTGSQGWGHFVDPDVRDHMHRSWWWLRTNLDTRERPLSNRIFSSIPGDSITLVYVETLTGGPLRVELKYKLTALSSTQAMLHVDWEVQNIASVVRTVDLFSYSDFDLNDRAGGDRGSLIAPRTVRYLKDLTAVDITASAGGYVGYEVDHFPVLLNKLNDSAVYNVSNTGLPFGPSDMTNVFQWRAVLGQGESLRGTLTKHVDTAIPEPGTWMLMLSGIVPFALRLRKKA